MKKILTLLLIAGVPFYFSACNDDDDNGTADNGVSITGIPATATIAVGETLGPVTATATAQDGLDELTVSRNGSVIETVPLSGTSATYEFTYTATEADGGSTIVFEFRVTDTDGDADEAAHALTVTPEETIIEVNSNITSDVTWETGNTYILNTRVAVEDGATLTIEPGVVVKGAAGQGTNATALLVARGGMLMAEGTATLPIIFTSVADQITPEDVAAGNIISPNLDPTINGLWGGILILGRAPISADAESVQIEGIPPSDTNGLYGGTDPEDNSGVMRYVSIRHGGTDIGDGNEINGLTLGGVGSGTTLEFIEIVANKDDGIEPFGGSVDVSNIIVWNQGDDAYDCDQAYTGTINNFIYIGGPESDHAMELDGPEGAGTGTFTLSNGTLKGFVDEEGDGEYIDFRDEVTANIINCYFFNFESTADVELDGAPEAQLYLDGDIVMTDLEFNTSHLTSGNTTIATIFKDNGGLNAFSTLPPDATLVTEPTVGADISAFTTGWSWAHAAGELDDF